MTLPLSIRGLEKSFGRFHAVRNLSREVRPREIYGLLGPNGSGKSTTLRCALGLLAPDEGELSILGVPSNQIHRLRGRVGVAFDEADLIPGLSARENLEYGSKIVGGVTPGRTDRTMARRTGEFPR